MVVQSNDSAIHLSDATLQRVIGSSEKKKRSFGGCAVHHLVLTRAMYHSRSCSNQQLRTQKIKQQFSFLHSFRIRVPPKRTHETRHQQRSVAVNLSRAKPDTALTSTLRCFPCTTPTRTIREPVSAFSRHETPSLEKIDTASSVCELCVTGVTLLSGAGSPCPPELPAFRARIIRFISSFRDGWRYIADSRGTHLQQRARRGAVM